VLATLVSGGLVGDAWPYGPAGERPVERTASVPLIPYHDWANRGPSTMRVWIPKG